MSMTKGKDIVEEVVHIVFGFTHFIRNRIKERCRHREMDFLSWSVMHRLWDADSYLLAILQVEMESLWTMNSRFRVEFKYDHPLSCLTMPRRHVPRPLSPDAVLRDQHDVSAFHHVVHDAVHRGVTRRWQRQCHRIRSLDNLLPIDFSWLPIYLFNAIH